MAGGREYATDTPPPSTGSPPPALREGGRAHSLRWRGRLLAVAKAPAAPPIPSPSPRRRPGDRGFRLLLCRWGGNSLQPWSPGPAHSHRGQHRPPPHPPGAPEAAEEGAGGGRRGSRRGRPASRGSRSSHAGCSSPHINSYCSGGRAPSGSSSGSGNGGDPPLDAPILPSRPAAPHLPSWRGRSGAAHSGLVPPHLEAAPGARRQPRSRLHPPSPPRHRCARC